MSERINVSVRIRPLSTQESEAGETKVFTRVASADRSGALVAEEGASAAARFTHVFTEDATNAEVFDRVGAARGETAHGRVQRHHFHVRADRFR